MAKRKRKAARRRRGLGLSRYEHVEHAAYRARRVHVAQVTCSTAGLRALMDAQSAVVHAVASGNDRLLANVSRKRDAILKRLRACLKH